MSDEHLLLQTDRLRLRFHEADDADDLLRVYSRPDVARYLLEEPWTADQTTERLAKRMARRDLRGEPHSLSVVISDSQGRYLGDLALWLTDVAHRQAEIGWVIDPEHAGQGYATEAAGALLRHAFIELGVHRVAAQMDARNIGSARLAERLGFRREAHLIEDLYCKGEYTDTYIYGMLARDLPASRP